MRIQFSISVEEDDLAVSATAGECADNRACMELQLIGETVRTKTSI